MHSLRVHKVSVWSTLPYDLLLPNKANCKLSNSQDDNDISGLQGTWLYSLLASTIPLEGESLTRSCAFLFWKEKYEIQRMFSFFRRMLLKTRTAIATSFVQIHLSCFNERPKISLCCFLFWYNICKNFENCIDVKTITIKGGKQSSGRKPKMPHSWKQNNQLIVWFTKEIFNTTGRYCWHRLRYQQIKIKRMKS